MRRRGEFWGRTGAKLELLSCEVQQLEATVPEDRVPLHEHAHGHFVFVPGGGYISSAMHAPELSLLPLLVFNPAGTRHRDRFLHGRGAFLAVTLDGDFQIREGLPVAIRSLQGLRAARLLSTRCGTAAFRWHEAEGALLTLIAAARSEKPLKGRPPGWLQRAHEMIWCSDSRKLSVGKVAQNVGVHPVHLARVFADYLGCSPGEALRGRRLERAAHFLGTARASLASVAFQSGFADQSHMTRAFTREFFITPAAYRRSRNVANVQEGPSRMH